ncbi:hypothetical protein CTM_24760 [Clostridium tetanomorphum DSM 665]|nr:hypothetical protein CTM_24760 [Clostridium tetanomorphum DSM 665]
MISNKLYGYKLVYTNEPVVLTGIVSASPIKWKGKAKIIKGRGSVAKGAAEAEKTFVDMMEPAEAARYESYWKQGAGSIQKVKENGEFV